MTRESVLSSEKDIKAVVKARNNDGLKWAEIAQKFGVSEGRVMFAFMVGTAEPMKNANAKTIAAARAQGESWGLIAARASMTEGAVRKLFEEGTGRPALGERIGKGGRHPGETNGSAPAPASKAAKATKAPAKAASPRGGGKLKSLVVSGKATLEDVQAVLTGKNVKVSRNDKEEVIGVAEVTGLKGSVITVKDNDNGRSRAIKAETIVGYKG